MSRNGLYLVKPTTVDKTGTGSTATINTKGSVTFSACTSISMNGVFTQEYDNYLIVLRATLTALAAFRLRVRSSGTDNTTANSYTEQYNFGNGTSVTGLRSTNNLGAFSWVGPTNMAGYIGTIYGPYLTQPTAWRTVSASNDGSGAIVDYAVTHSQSTSYDGFTLYNNGLTQSASGLLAVYGMRN